MLYKRRNEEKLNQELFQHPTSEYRAAPLWAWNCKLEQKELEHQIESLKQMGFGGFYMHSRTGLATTYLGKEYMEIVKGCVEKAKKENMLAWIYDEDRWPSGFAGGYVTKDKKYRQVSLLFTPKKKEESETCIFLAAYEVELDAEGYLKNYKKTELKTEKDGIWHAYLCQAEESPWYNDQTYVNTLDKEAIQQFCKVTHEAYKKQLGEELGDQVPGFFTDEPQFSKKMTLGFAKEKKELLLPWTYDLAVTFFAAYSTDILEKIPELIWNLPDGRFSQIRYYYHAHISERFAQAYAETLGKWCEDNNCILTGHMMEEPTLKSQTAALGEVMRSLSAFPLPGVDMLCDRREYTTVKQAASVSHQYGREGVLSESYGVTGWDFDFRGHKLQGDWQAALGVTLRAPHLSWVSMEGEAKRDYPASLNYQAPWYQRYSLVEDHFARLNTAMVRGKVRIHVGVIHPVESYWLLWGPQEQSADQRKQLDEDFKNITEWLLFGQVDFDYISESLLPGLCEQGQNPLNVGKQTYDAIIIPGCITLRTSTWERLSGFVKQEGKLILAGDRLQCLDAKPDERARQLADAAVKINMDRCSVLKAVEDERELAVYWNTGERTEHLLTQLREDGENRFLLIAHGKHPRASEETDRVPGKDVLPQENIHIVLNGEWTPVLWDTMTGDIKKIYAEYGAGKTVIPYTFYGHDSILLQLLPGRSCDGIHMEKPIHEFRLGRKAFETSDAPSPVWNQVDYSLAEPNVLLLDQAEYFLDQGSYAPLEEVLRLDNILRKQLGYPLRQDAFAQPWTVKEQDEIHYAHLRYIVESELENQPVEIGLENAENTKISWNGEAVKPDISGYYTDRCIKKVKLGKLEKGENILELEVPFDKRHGIEACYLLGDFGVKVCGRKKKIIAVADKLAFGDITDQGLPFYGGSIDYHVTVHGKGKDVFVRASWYRGALIDVFLDDKLYGSIVFSPYQIVLKNLTEGEHRITFRLYGNRVNTFGGVHNCNEHFWWHGPDEYRVNRDEWTYGYCLKPMGILKSPEIFDDIRYRK